MLLQDAVEGVEDPIDLFLAVRGAERETDGAVGIGFGQTRGQQDVGWGWRASAREASSAAFANPTILRDDGQPAFATPSGKFEVTPSILAEHARGQVPYRARLTRDIIRGAVEANMGGGGPRGSQAWRECNVNELTDLQQYDPISGFPIYKSLLCEVERSEAAGTNASTSPVSRAEVARGRAPNQTQTVRREVYLDHNATTLMQAEVLEAMLPFLKDQGGNPSSIHALGERARDAVDAARRKLASAIGSTARRLVFTASGSEVNNLAIKGALGARPERRHLITSSIEHPAVLQTCRAMQAMGYELDVIAVDGSGLIDPRELERKLRQEAPSPISCTAEDSLAPLRSLLLHAHPRA